VYGSGEGAAGADKPDPLSVSWSQLDPMLATQTFTSMSQLPGVMEGTSLLTDFAAFLRRPMLQQAPVRKALYDGLHALAADKECALCIFNILSPSLHKHVRWQVQSFVARFASHVFSEHVLEREFKAVPL
jgi:hypothetical protein